MAALPQYAVSTHPCSAHFDEAAPPVTAAPARAHLPGAWPYAAGASSPAVHEGVTCDVCLQCPLQGVRHKCLVCPDYDVCGACLAAPGSVHPEEHPTLALRCAPHAAPEAAPGAPSWEQMIGRLAFPAGLALTNVATATPGAAEHALFTELGAVAERHVLANAGCTPDAARRLRLVQQRAESRKAVGGGGRASLLEPALFAPVRSKRLQQPPPQQQQQQGGMFRGLGIPAGGVSGNVFGANPFGAVPAAAPGLGTTTAMAYRPQYDALCLVSLADGLPVVALQLVCQTRTAITPLRPPPTPAGATALHQPPAHVFEGLVASDEAQMNVALTNLCATGTVCVELTRVTLDRTWRVAAEAPRRLNAVNVLRPGESVAVDADAADGCALVLRALRLAGGAHVPVARNLRDDDATKLGAHLRVRVTPQAGSEHLAARLRAGVRWAVLDAFVREPFTAPAPAPGPFAAAPTGPFAGGGLFGNAPAPAPFGGGPGGAGPGAAAPAASPFAAPGQLFGAGGGALFPMAQAAAPFGAVAAAAPAGASTPLSFGAPAPGGFGAPVPGGFGAPVPGGFGAPAPGGFGAPVPGGFGAPVPGGFGAPAAVGFAPQPATAPAAVSPAAAAAAAAARVAMAGAMPQPVAEAAVGDAAMALSAAAAALVAGPPMPPAAVAPAPAALTWHVTLAAEALLGLAVQPALSAPALQICQAGLTARATELLDALERGTAARELLEGLNAVHASTECVACLESNPPPDTIFTPCGHLCMHWEEAARVERCPMCRAIISGRMCLSDGRIVAAPTRPLQMFNTRQHMQAAGGFLKPVVYLYPPPDAPPMNATVTVHLAVGAGGGARFTALVPTPSSRVGAGEVTWRVRVLSRSGALRVEPPAAKAAAAAASSASAAAAEAHAVQPPPPVASLFWEADAPVLPGTVTPDGCGGFVSVPGAALGDWLLHALRAAGLSPREYTEMASFWAGRVGHHPYVALRFLQAAEIDACVATLHVTPAPDAMLRIYLLCRGVREPPLWAPEAPPHALAAAVMGGDEGGDLEAAHPPRHGFTVVEWGGSEI